MGKYSLIKDKNSLKKLKIKSQIKMLDKISNNFKDDLLTDIFNNDATIIHNLNMSVLRYNDISF